MLVFRGASQRCSAALLALSNLRLARGVHGESFDKIFGDFKVRSKVDFFGGVTVDTTNLVKECSDNQFAKHLADFEQQCVKEKRPAIWVKIVLDRSSLIGTIATLGYTFHHAKDKNCVMTKWLDKTCASKLPLYCTHRVSVGGIVVQLDRFGRISNDAQFLFIRERHSPYRGWKFPGGMIDLGEHLSTAAEREVFEETSVKSKFQSVLAFRQAASMPPFGISDLYVLCRLTALTTEIKPCAREIEECRWFRLDELRATMAQQMQPRVSSSTEKANSDNKQMAKAERAYLAPIVARVLQILEYGVQHGFESIEFSPNEIPAAPSSKQLRPAIFFHHSSIKTATD